MQRLIQKNLQINNFNKFVLRKFAKNKVPSTEPIDLERLNGPVGQ